jgi:pyruvate dehydrogenase E2 component (dihydrolipoamide acetyltransferase)
MDTVVMPKLSDMMEEGKILAWSKKMGDEIKKGDPLAEVETEKVNIEIESFFTGTLLEILVPAGSSVPVGTPIAHIGTPGEVPTNQLSKAGATEKEIVAAQMNSIAPPSATTVIANASQPVTPTNNSRIKASPLARRLAEEHHIDLSMVRGSGPEGRIVKEDIEAVLVTAQAQPAPISVAEAAQSVSQPPVTDVTQATPAQPAQPQSQSVVATGDVEIVPLSNMRRTIARRLQESMQTTPHFYVTMAMDATRLNELRQQLNHALESQHNELRISFNDLIVLAVARTLTQRPEINASFDGDRILRHKSVHIGVAVALDTGLIVPVVRDANKRSITDLAKEIRRLADAARTSKLRPDEFTGGTFTISNLGMLGVEDFTAIINPPESAILAVGAIVPTPVVVDGQIVVRDQIKMTLSADHRAIDGAQAAYFMRDLKQLIEAPATILL